MTDASSTPPAPISIQRGDYRPFEWEIPEIDLNFQLDAQQSIVQSRFRVERKAAQPVPLILRGDGLSVGKLQVDGQDYSDWRMDGPDLVIDLGARQDADILIETTIDPSSNSQLMGLFASGDMLCTQCEAEGFRRITFHPDRPDVLSLYKVRMEADKNLYPILLSNGNCIESGDIGAGRHFAIWQDPWPKPSYLFALVAGKLIANSDQFTTQSGRDVAINIWVREGDESRTGHAMKAVKDSMAWDEQVYGREYDLDLFNIVAVSDFNMGAMENKGLNIFNSRYILADQETATDVDYDGVEGVVAHEYFHNWTGNRITCRDWFQLSLKEGLTVYRDQCFSADMGSEAVKRIEDVRILRAAQFPEDAGPLAHPIRPESYQEISNFYTATIYNKGAEIIRMMANLLGPKRYRAAMDLYFERHDGEAATCEDFIRAMEDGGAMDLSQFRLWYEQAGTPRLSLMLQQEGDDWSLIVQQMVPSTPDRVDKKPMMMPLRVAAFAMDGNGGSSGEEMLIVKAAEQAFSLGRFASRPALSINRGFSAPVIIDYQRTDGELAWLAAHDDDPFARYEAYQQLMLDQIMRAITGGSLDQQAVMDAARNMLGGRADDPAFVAEAMMLPSEAFIGDQMLVVDPDAIRTERLALQAAIGQELEPDFRAIITQDGPSAADLSPAAKGMRKLRAAALNYLMIAGFNDVPQLALGMFRSADGMTEKQAALAALAHGESPERESALNEFFEQYQSNALVVDKWFQVQAWSMREDTPDLVERLAAHPLFTLANPNRVRALYGAFAGNQAGFHRADGKGYQLIADMVIALDAKNPQTAARMIPPLGRWKRFDEGRSVKMRAALERILAQKQLSRDVTEQAMKSLLT